MTGRLARGDGSSTTELVLLMPAVLLLIMVSVQAGLYLHAQQVVEAAAQQALEAAQAEGGQADTGQNEGESFLAEAGGVREPTVVVTRTADQVSVEVRGVAPNVLPLSAWAVAASADGPVERFVAEDQR